MSLQAPPAPVKAYSGPAGYPAAPPAATTVPARARPQPPCLTAALEYLARGWSALALCPPDHAGVNGAHESTCTSPGKRPCGQHFERWLAYQERLPSETTLRLAWSALPNANVGMATGPVSGVLALDLEGETAERKLLELSGGEVVETPEFTTGKGRRPLFAWPEGLELPNKQLVFGDGEIRVLAKGRQTVMPPSLHPSGVRYAWKEGRGPGQIPLAPVPPWLLDLLRDLAAGKPARPAVPPVRLDTRTPDAVLRAAAYIAKYPPGVEGQDASGNAFALAGRLVRGFSLDAETALRLMLHSDWNGRCARKDGRPYPWSEKELRHKIDGALRAPEKEPEGYLLNAPRKDAAAPRPTAGASCIGHSEAPDDESCREVAAAKERSEPAPAPRTSGLVTTCLGTIRIEPVRWLVPAYFPSGKLVLGAGDGGNGKSAFTLDTAACITTGRPCLGLKYDAPPAADVLLIACEDGYEDTVVPRLLAAGADLRRCHRLDGLRAKDGKLAPFSLAHYEELRRHLRANKGIRFVVIDPAGSYIGRAGVDENKDAELRSLLDPLAQLASECGTTVLLVKHLNKGATAKAVHKVGGSMGYTNAVRAAYMVAPDPDDCTLKLLMPIKFNCGQWPPALSFRIKELAGPESAAVLREHGTHLTAEDQQLLADQLHRITWLGVVDRDADQVMGAASQQGKNKVEACAAWLREFLREYAFPSDEIKVASEAAGFTFDNLKEAKALLKKKEGLRSTNSNTFQGKWWCGLGEPATWRRRPESPPGAPHTPYSPLSPGSPHTPHTGLDHGRVGSVGSGGSGGSGGREAEDSPPDEYGDAWEGA